jgi:carboxyl-terminal processing protease
MRLLPALLAVVLSGAAPGDGATQDSRAYLEEVRRHLRESYVDGASLDDAKLTAAAIRGLDGALARAGREAARAALKGQDTIAGALDAAAAADPGLDLGPAADAAARAMVAETGDPYSRILEAGDLKQLVRMIFGGGAEPMAGLAVELAGGRARASYVQLGSPADREGLELGDEIVSLGGRAAKDLKAEDLAGLLRLPAGRVLEIVVRRHGKPYAYTLKGDGRSPPPTVLSESLPEGVGSLRLTIFDAGAADEVRSALRKLRARGLRGLVLDLRQNPGGALAAAVGIADLFLPEGLVVANLTSPYRPTLGGFKLPGLELPAEFKTASRSGFEEVPMVCLVDGASASASEFLAGSLRDHGRAVLVGAKTYGKGVGQTPILLTSMLFRRFLYLTVMRYTTPQGRAVDHVGVEPHVPAGPVRFGAEDFDAVRSLRTGGALERYLDGRGPEELRRLAAYDRFETASWPGFDDFHRGLGTRLAPDAVREQLRLAARRRTALEGCDLQGDAALQRAVAELLDRLPK